MPPKNQSASKKTIEKQKQKIIEDKTFGLKNKKGSKQQKFVQQVQKQVTHGNKSAKDLERLEREKQDRKEEKKREKAELNELFKPVAELQKCAKGVDPKSVLCVFFKQNQCAKGDKCKFSHDLAVERKSEKRQIYTEENRGDDFMNDWDIEKLEEVVTKKHADRNRSLPPSAIVCKYFLEAVENMKYGWFWECPNGISCHYKHALPQGFVLKRDQKKMEEQKQDEISLDDLVEKERQALGMQQTKVTYKTFIEWKKRKRLEKMELGRSAKAKREADFKQGRTTGISGREMFEFNPALVSENMEDGGVDDVVEICCTVKEEEEEDGYTGPLREIDANTFMLDDETEHNFAGGTVDEDLFIQADLDELEQELEEFEINDATL